MDVSGSGWGWAMRLVRKARSSRPGCCGRAVLWRSLATLLLRPRRAVVLTAPERSCTTIEQQQSPACRPDVCSVDLGGAGSATSALGLARAKQQCARDLNQLATWRVVRECSHLKPMVLTAPEARSRSGLDRSPVWIRVRSSRLLRSRRAGPGTREAKRPGECSALDRDVKRRPPKP
jgi:hypothetical protein